MDLQIINAVWGEKYLDAFLELSLPTQFSKGNLEGLWGKPRYIIYTDGAGEKRITSSPLYAKLQKWSALSFRPIRQKKESAPFDILLDCHSDAIKKANQERAPLVFLSPDCLLSTGVFSYIEKSVAANKRLIAICSARMSLEKYRKIVQNRGEAARERVDWTPQELATTTVHNLHHRGRCLIMGDGKIPTLPSQMYWQLDDNNLLAKAFHLHPLLLWPEVAGVYPTLSADGKDFLEKICPDPSKWEVIKDCQTISLFEISREEQFTDDTRVSLNGFYFRKWAVENTSAAHHYFIHQNIILGDGREKQEWREKIEAAQRFLETTLFIGRKYTSRSKVYNKIMSYYHSSLLSKVGKDFFKWHATLFYYVISGKKKFTWKKLRNHFSYLLKYKDFPIHTLNLTSRDEE